MASFIVNGYSTVARTLLSGETGLITQGSTLVVGTDHAITGTDFARVLVEGGLHATDDSDSAFSFGGSRAELRVGQNGMVTAWAGEAVDWSVTAQAIVYNYGSIVGYNIGVDIATSTDNADIDIHNSGTIEGSTNALFLNSGTGRMTVINEGSLISDAGPAIRVFATERAHIVNTGSIIGFGSIYVAEGLVESQADEVRNSGTMIGYVHLRSGNDFLGNSGIIAPFSDGFASYQIEMGDGDDTIENALGGSIEGQIVMGDGNDNVVNHGEISGILLLSLFDPQDTTDESFNSLVNTGLIDGAVRGGRFVDMVFNEGLINGNIRLQQGADVYDGQSGQVIGTIFGENGNDTLIGGSMDDWIDGGNENDNLAGRGGDDTLEGGNGNDVVSGGDGDDSIDGGAGSDRLGGGAGNDQMIGGGGNDTMTGSTGNDTMEGNDGGDLINGGDGDDNLNGGNGLDSMLGGAGNDTMGGGEAADVMYGGDGNDSMLGWVANDLLFGNSGNDYLNGQSGEDTLNGGWGDDVLTGGTEADVFAFVIKSGDDVITDFENNADLIDLSAFNTTFGAMQSAISAWGGGSLIDLDAMGGEGSIWVQGTPVAYLNANDFIF